jgi:poly(3-hydroxybutyrate) depolymerase
MHRIVVALCALVAAALVAPPRASAAPLADFIDYSLRNNNGQVVLPGRLYAPPEASADPATPRPFIVYLHGSGAAGTNNTRQVEGMADYLLDEVKRRGSFLYAPQTPSNWDGASVLDNAMTMIDRAVTERGADPRRLYATGYSLGGGGTWNLLNRYDGRFAAAVPISGVSPVGRFDPAKILGTGIWAIHARDDASVPVAATRNVISSLLVAGHEPPPTFLPLGSTSDVVLSNANLDLLYYELGIGGHTGPFGFYFVPPLYDWLFAHSLPVPEPGAAMLFSCGLPAISRARHVKVRSMNRRRP